jgi:Fic family protein
MKYELSKEVIEFLQHSNYIEEEYSKKALEDAKIAWIYALEDKNNFQLDYMLNIHKLLMKNLKPNIAGKLRDCPIFLVNNGKIIEKIPQFSQKELEEKLNDLSCLYNFNKEKFDKEKIMQWHINFEHIHPFRDGNGRTGRILMNIQYINAKLPILIIHEGEEQQKYYNLFKRKK